MSVHKNFVLAGKAIFTVEAPASFAAADRPHYTFRVTYKPASLRFPDAYFVGMLTGSDNEHSYSYVGMLDAGSGEVALTRKSKYREDTFSVMLLRRTLARIWANELHVVEAAGFKVHHEGRCGRCGRTLTVPASIESGIGPECIKMMAA